MKVLIIRFSSIGDIVLTSPVIRSLKQGLPAVEVHFLTKAAFRSVLEHNPYIDQLHLLEGKLGEVLTPLKAHSFDYILDLHHNMRSWRVKQALRGKAFTFPKGNWDKYRMTRFKARDIRLPHIVERYGATLQPLGITLDNEGLDFFLPPEAEASAAAIWDTRQHRDFVNSYLAVVLGASYRTKRWVPKYFPELLNAYGHPVLLLGGQDTREDAALIERGLKVGCINRVGKDSIPVAAALMKQCHAVLTHDTGFMHIAAAFGMQIYSLWGNTVPEFGMTPYKTPHEILEVKPLSCRPCSKLGFDDCPQRHFKCMKQLTPEYVLQRMQAIDDAGN